MLDAHGVKLSQHLPGLEDAELDDTFLIEESTFPTEQSAAQITHHSAEDLGTVAVTVVSGKRQMNLYPLQANGLNELQQYIHEQGYGGSVAFPAGICYDETKRQLKPDCL